MCRCANFVNSNDLNRIVNVYGNKSSWIDSKGKTGILWIWLDRERTNSETSWNIHFDASDEKKVYFGSVIRFIISDF